MMNVNRNDRPVSFRNRRRRYWGRSATATAT
jgi:hypothetical protein